MIKNYKRDLTPRDKKLIQKEVSTVQKTVSKTINSILLKIPIWIVFGISIYYFTSLWLIVPISIICFFMIWMFILEIKDLFELPRFIKNKLKLIDTGIVRVQEINIDRYIKISNYNDDGNHYIVEYDGMLSLIGGQEFLGIRKLKNKVESIMIMDSNEKFGYHERIEKSGDSLNALYTFKNGLSDSLFNSQLWEDLTNREPFPGSLEDLKIFISEDKKQYVKK